MIEHDSILDIKRQMKLSEIAEKLACHLDGDGELDIGGVGTLEVAIEGQISFLTNLKYLPEAKKTKASAIIADRNCPDIGKPLLRHENPYFILAKVIELFFPAQEHQPHIHPTACVSKNSVIGKRVSIGANSYIDDDVVLGDDVQIGPLCALYRGVVIGSETVIYSGCAIREYVSIGARCIIHNNVVVGSDGFGYARISDGRWYKLRQAGTVVIEDDVEIGACTTIDRATLGETRVKSNTKIDNLVQIGHGSVVGSSALLCAQVGLAGSTEVGNRVILAGQVGSAGHLKIGDDAIATGQTGIPGDVEPGKVISGSPAIDNKQWLKSSALFSRLPEIRKTIRTLEGRVSSIEKRFNVMPEDIRS